MVHPLTIWLITVGEPLPRPGNAARLWRTGILARTLLERGHEVIWWTSTVDHFQKRHMATSSSRERLAPNFELQFLHGRLYTRNISFARLLNHRDIAGEFRRLAAEAARPDVVLCSYPTIELSEAAVEYGHERGIPILLDVRDMWPDEIAARLPRALRPVAPWVLFPLYRSARRAFAGATGIVAISKTYLAWARAFGGRVPGACDLFAPMGYEARLAATAPEAVIEKMRRLGVDTSRRIVWFCGTFVGSIDLATVIDAARMLARDPSLQFVFTGTGERDAEWRRMAHGMQNVVFTGWADRDELGWLARHAWVGLGAYKPHAMMSLTNKLFEYMAAGLPLVSSLTGEPAELLIEHEIGLTYAAGDASDLAGKLRELAGDPPRTQRLARNALALFEGRFSADRVYTEYAEHLECCAAPESRRTRPELTPHRIEPKHVH